MKFQSVKIQNFGTIGEAEVQLSDRGLVLIQGENMTNSAANSNGAGKSTVVEAISWCLYGKTAKGQSGDSVINRSAGKECFVEVTIADDDTVYGVKRHRKHKTGKNRLEIWSHEGDISRQRTLTKGTDKLTQAVVDQIIGCPYEVFVGAVYAGQERMPDLPSMTDKQLKLLIEEAAGITLLEQAHEIAKTKLSDAKLAFEQKERDVERAGQGVERAADRLEDAKTSAKRWTGERDARVMDLEDSARILLRDSKELKEEIEGLTSEAELLKERDKIKAKLDQHSSDQAELKRLETEAIKAQREADGAKMAAETKMETLKEAQTELDALNGQIGRPCTSCGRPHDSDSLASAIEAKQKAVAEHKREAKARVERYKELASDAQKARDSTRAFSDDMTDMTRIVSLSDAISQRLAKLHDRQGRYSDTLRRAKEAVESVKKERAKINPYDADIEARSEALDEARKAHAESKAELPEARREVDIARSVVEVYSPKGVRAHILDTVTPYLNERTAHYLGALADGEFEAIWQTLTMTAKGEPRENFSIQVTGSDGGGSFADLSGGEKRKVRIACALALQDLVATRASKSLDLFIADEIDAALDTSALERLMGVLDEKARERGSVFIISHSDLRDWVSNVMVVEKENSVSTVKEAA